LLCVAGSGLDRFVRCSIPDFGGAAFSNDWRDALWATANIRIASIRACALAASSSWNFMSMIGLTRSPSNGSPFPFLQSYEAEEVQPDCEQSFGKTSRFLERHIVRSGECKRRMGRDGLVRLALAAAWNQDKLVE